MIHRRAQPRRCISEPSAPTRDRIPPIFSAGRDPKWDVPPAGGPAMGTAAGSVASVGVGPAVDPDHLMFSPCGEIVPACFAQSAVASVYVQAPPIGPGHPRNLLAPATEVTGARVHLCCSGMGSRRNARRTSKSMILRDGHGISIGRYSQKLKQVLDLRNDRGGA